MTPNLRSLVAKAYRVRQGRTFSSSSSAAPNPIRDKDLLRIFKIDQDTEQRTQQYKIEAERFLDELSRSRR